MMGIWPKRINRAAQARKMWVNFIYSGKEHQFLNFLVKLKVFNEKFRWQAAQEIQKICWEHNRLHNRDERRKNDRYKSYVESPKSIKPTKYRRF